VIGIAGTRADPVMLHFATRCVAAGVPFADVDLMETVRRGDWDLSLPPAPSDWICGAEEVLLAELSGIYVRPIFLGTTDRERVRWAGLLEGLNAWLDETPATVVNRPGGFQFNSYKPAHYAWLAAHGLRVPPSLMSSDRERIRAFLAGGRTVVKPICGVRATTRELTEDGLDRLDASDVPVMVQRLVAGDDIRAHVVGDTVVAARFSSKAIDYRKDPNADKGPVTLPHDLTNLLIELTAKQGLLFAGWDFKMDPDESYWCLECNPMPGYSHYDRVCDYRISEALIRVLQDGC
jgi:ribosomal protein S6-L-glutamate ligase RimK-like protein